MFSSYYSIVKSKIGLVEVLPVLFFVIFICYMKFRHSRRRLYTLVQKLPMLAGELPLIGHAHLFLGVDDDFYPIIESLGKQSLAKRLVSLWMGPKMYIVTVDPDFIDVILNNALGKDFVYGFLKPLLGDGLITGPVPLWRNHRKTMDVMFNQTVIDGCLEMVKDQSCRLVKNLQKEVGKEQFDCAKYIFPCTLDIICETVVGTEMAAQEMIDVPYLDACKYLQNVVVKRMVTIWQHPDFIFKFFFERTTKEKLSIMENFTSRMIRQKQSDYFKKGDISKNASTDTPLESGKISKINSLVDRLLELTENDTWTDQQLCDEVNTMTVAGFNTLATVVDFALLLLGSHPHFQDEIFHELSAVFGNDPTTRIQNEQLSQLTLLECTIKEVMRLFPAVPLVIRKTGTEINLGEYLIPKDTGCCVSIIGLHRRKDIWGDDAEEFNPHRFLPQNCTNRHPRAYIPFGTGSRFCIGSRFAKNALKIIIATVLRSYKVSSDKDFRKLSLKMNILIKSMDGYPISLSPRETRTNKNAQQ